MTKILIVEDNKDLLELYVMFFKDGGYDVKYAQNGQEALDIIKAYKFDVILLDIMMPVLNGGKVIETLRNENNNVKIVVNSNMFNEDEQFIDMGADKFIRKSDFTATGIVREVNKYLNI